MAKETVFKFILDGKTSIGTLGQIKQSILGAENELKKLKKETRDSGKVTKEQAAQMAKLDTRLKGLRGSYREATNAASGLTKAGLRFRDKIGQGLINQFKQIGATIAVAFSVGAIKSFVTESIKAFDVQQKAEKSLLTALGGRQDVQQNLIRQAQQLQQTTLFGDEETIKAQSILAQLGATEEQITKLIPSIQDFATAQGIDLASAASLVAKSTGSSTNALARYGIEIEGAAGSNERTASAVEALSNAFGGQAEAAANTGLGPITQLKNAYGDLQEGIGGALVPSGKWIGTLQRITENTTALLANPLSNEIKLERIQFNDLAKSALDANLPQEERVELLKEAQQIAPGFLANLDLEAASHEQIAEAVNKQNQIFEKRLDLQLAIETQSLIQADIDQGITAIAERTLLLQQQQVETQNGANVSRQEENIILTDLAASWADITGQGALNMILLDGANKLEEDLLKSNQEQLELAEQQTAEKEEQLRLLEEQQRIESKQALQVRGVTELTEEQIKDRQDRINKEKHREDKRRDEREKEEREFLNRINKANLEADKLRIMQIEDDVERKEALAVFEFEQKIANLDSSIQAEADLIALHEQQLIETIQEIRRAGDEADMMRRIELNELFREQQLQQEQEEIDRLTRMDEVRAGFTQKFQDQEDAKRKAQQETLEATARLFGASAALAEAFGLESKGLAVTEAIIATYLGATKALTPATPVDGLTGANFIRAAAIIATGLANITKINAAAGGGDFVTTKPTLLMVGDNPGGRERVTVEPLSGKGKTRINPNSGLLQMAGGGSLTVDAARPSLNANQRQAQQLIDTSEALRDRPIQVSVEEIRDVSTNVSVTETRADI